MLFTQEFVTKGCCLSVLHLGVSWHRFVSNNIRNIIQKEQALKQLKHHIQLWHNHGFHFISIHQSTIRKSFRHGQITQEDPSRWLGKGGRGSNIEAEEEEHGDRHEEGASKRYIEGDRCCKNTNKAITDEAITNEAITKSGRWHANKERKEVGNCTDNANNCKFEINYRLQACSDIDEWTCTEIAVGKKKSKAEDEDEASLSDTVDYQDPNTILWLKAEGVADALKYHYPDHEEYLELDYHEQILLLVKVFKPAEMRSVLQGLLTDAGKNWCKLKLQKKLRSMGVLAPEFAKVCVELFNAKTELEMSKSVPEDIVIDHDKSQKKITS